MALLVAPNARPVSTTVPRCSWSICPLRDLLLRAKHLSVAAIDGRGLLGACAEFGTAALSEIDHDPRWHRFLLERDALSGQIRQSLLNEAVARGDANRVVHFFRTFLQAEQAADRAPDPGTRQRHAAVPLEKRIYTNESIAKLYERRRKGGFTDAEWARLEGDLFQAQGESRVQARVYLTK